MKRLYNLNEKYFDVIDSEDKAYWLGFLYADGCINERNKHYNIILDLQHSDKEHIANFLKCIESEHPIYEYSKNGKKYAKISIGSKHMFNSLCELGCIPNKTYEKIKMPDINDELKIHFIRGFLDGDGWISLKKHTKGASIGMVSNYKDILVDIQSFLEKNNIYSLLREEKKGHFTLNIGKSVEQVKFLKLIYNNPKIYLDRKYINCQEIMKWSS